MGTINWNEIGRQILAQQPFSVFLGAELVRLAPGEAELALAIRPEFLQQHGFVHGGVLSYLMDNVLTFAGGSALGPEVMTAEYKINYLRPAQGKRLVARARVVHAGRKLAVVQGEIVAENEPGEPILVAVGQGTIARR